jgi:hypothetical protein
MYDAACAPKAIVIVRGASHGAYARAGGAEFDRELVEFFDAALRSPRVAAGVARGR